MLRQENRAWLHCGVPDRSLSPARAPSAQRADAAAHDRDALYALQGEEGCCWPAPQYAGD